MVPYCWMRLLAVFSPMPFTPGIWSEVSPHRPFRSIILMGSKPYSSSKAAGVTCFTVVCPRLEVTRFTVVWSVTS